MCTSICIIQRCTITCVYIACTMKLADFMTCFQLSHIVLSSRKGVGGTWHIK